MRVFGKIAYILFSVLLFGIVALLLSTMFTIPGSVEVKIVKSGSMEPAIQTGAVIVTRPTAAYRTGDVITFENASSDIPTTHRIVGVEESGGAVSFVTKGDANEEADNAMVARDDVLGKVLFDIPYAGFVLDFSRQPMGFVFLVGLPALLIILDELSRIWKEIQKIRRRKQSVLCRQVVHKRRADPEMRRPQQHTTVRMMDIGRPAVRKTVQRTNARKLHDIVPRRSSHMATLSFALVALGSAFLVGGGAVGTTFSYPVDVETSTENLLQTSEVDFQVVNGAAQLALLNETSDSDVDTHIFSVEGGTDVRYDLRTEMISGDSAFCNGILAAVDEPFSYNGALLYLTASDVSFGDSWTLTTQTPEGFGSCVIDLIYTAWHEDEENDTGYTDEERVTLGFYGDTPVILQTFSVQSDSEESVEGDAETEEGLEETETPEEAEEKPEIPVAEEVETSEENKEEENHEEEADEEKVVEEKLNEEKEQEPEEPKQTEESEEEVEEVDAEESDTVSDEQESEL